MAYNYPISCVDENANTGTFQECENTQISPCSFVLVPRGASIATKSAAETLSNWKTNFKLAEPNRWKPFPVCDNITPEDTENTMKERPFKGGKFIAYGKRGYTMDLDLNSYSATQFFKLNGKQWDIYEIDDNGNIQGISTDGIKFEPVQLLTMQILPPKTPAPGENMVTKVKIVLAETENQARNRVVINPTTWNPSDEFDGVHNVDLTVSGGWTATGGSVRVTFSGSGKPVTGLVAADFAIPGKTISSATASGDGGTYTIVSTGLVTSTIDLVACSSISLTAYAIESTGEADFTVS